MILCTLITILLVQLSQQTTALVVSNSSYIPNGPNNLTFITFIILKI